MTDDTISIHNDSGDKKYFTIIPNYILNHSTANAQALYLQLKRLAGEGGRAFPSSRYLREKLRISQPTLRKEMKYLLEKGWIEYTGTIETVTSGGKQKIKSYKIVDLWQKNVEHYQQRGEKIDTPKPPRGEKIDTQGVKKSTPNKNHLLIRTNKGRRLKFTSPTQDQVKEYCDERENKIDARLFCDTYEARGWMIGKSKMKDWRAAVRTWEKRGQEFAPRQRQKQSGNTMTLHDGIIAVNKFGTWVMASDPNVRIDPAYYPEITKT